MNDTEFWTGMLGGALIGCMVGLFIGVSIPPTENYNHGVVCEYEGGQVEGEACIKDDKVIEIDLG